MKCKNCKGDIEIDGCGGWKHSDGQFYRHHCEPPEIRQPAIIDIPIGELGPVEVTQDAQDTILIKRPDGPIILEIKPNVDGAWSWMLVPNNVRIQIDLP